MPPRGRYLLTPRARPLLARSSSAHRLSRSSDVYSYFCLFPSYLFLLYLIPFLTSVCILNPRCRCVRYGSVSLPSTLLQSVRPGLVRIETICAYGRSGRGRIRAQQIGCAPSGSSCVSAIHAVPDSLRRLAERPRVWPSAKCNRDWRRREAAP